MDQDEEPAHRETGHLDRSDQTHIANLTKHDITSNGMSDKNVAVKTTARDSVVATFQGDLAEESHHTLSRKRKSPGHDAGSRPIDALRPGDGPKKVKLAEDNGNQFEQSSVGGRLPGGDKSLLSAEIWHHIFTFCPPKLLGNLLRVNKLFNLYLDPSSSVHRKFPISVTHTALAPLKPNAIWQASRRLFWPQMPTPLRSKAELDMWRLICSPRCQNCNKPDTRDRATSHNASRPSPGREGVAIIWPFATRACASCLLQTSIKEVDLLLSPSIPTAIVPALPVVYLTQELHVLPSTSLEQGQPPTDIQVTKLFSPSDVEPLKQEFLAVKDMGSGTVDEWLKGLGGRGTNLRNQTSKWEKWESSGGLAKLALQLYPGRLERSSASQTANHSVLVQPIPSSSSSPSSRLPPAPASLPARHERTAEEVTELKAARKAEIERRALLLSPPLAPDVLRHIPSFQAATHIITPLDDNAWELLKPRLLAQRLDAEQREREAVSQAKASQERVERRHLETTLATTKEARELIDKDWEEIQAPVRVRISGYADEIISEAWEKGKKVTKDTCPKFAADVLIYVRKRFYAEVAKDAAAAKAAGQTPVVDPPEGPFTQKLTLENMKWIFDTKIKPHTESYRKELFYCNGCDGNLKSFGFEGVIQHYAAKHTSSLSVGSIVVHWRAEWPEQPPFSPDARVVKQPHYGPTGLFTGAPPIPQTGYSYQFAPGPVVLPSYSSHPGYGAPPYGDPYHSTPPQPYQPPTVYPPFPPQVSYGQQQIPYAAQPTPYQPYQPSAGPYPVEGVDPGSAYSAPQGGGYNYDFGSYQPGVPSAYPAAPPHVYPDNQQTKPEDLARNSREVWQALAGVKDLPGSAKVLATIYHLVKRFRSRFYETPPLTMFIEGLSNNKDMRPVRNVNGLVCRTCHFGLGNAASIEEDRKSFSLPQLTNHFQFKHIEPMQQQNMPPLDWVVDMVLFLDEAALSHIRSIGDYQKTLLAEAFPSAFQPQPITGPNVHQQATHQHHAGYGELRRNIATGDRDNSFNHFPRPQITHPRTREGQAVSSSYLSHDRPGIFQSPNDHSNPDQSQAPSFIQNTLQGTVHTKPGYEAERFAGIPPPIKTPEHFPTTRAGDVRHSPQPARQKPEQHSREQNSHLDQKRGSSRNKRGKAQGNGDVSRRLFEEEAKKDDEEARREEKQIRAMWAADRVDAVRTFPLSRRLDRVDNAASFYAPALSQQMVASQLNNLPAPLSRKTSAPPTPVNEESNLLAALEMHLDQGRHPAPTGQHVTPPGANHVNDRNVSIATESRGPSRSYIQYGNDDEQPIYSPDGARYRPVRRESPLGRQSQLAHQARPAPAERYQSVYDDYRSQAEMRQEAPAPRFEDRRYDSPASRIEDRGYAADAHTEYYQYPREPVPQPRQTVEAYEIVHVIDGQEEYYIRRPARHEPEVRYSYGESRKALHREVEPHANEPVYNPILRAGQPQGPLNVYSRREPSQLGPRAEPRTDARDDPAYYEEYDPRFPAA
ncbi:hypothetical protein B0H67DRAFT_548476 [Lasiosphaeris hirsuta]|uniref:DUF7892 domain-containing protein n=1 Tax=Lasiosphaeris hirsuta TaxID=260670 RepID=A0AA40BA61_9PEZI|nr:hypothetical protein B0H67DRAFT_548476 [Lasiosphaeris hirsuta]